MGIFLVAGLGDGLVSASGLSGNLTRFQASWIAIPIVVAYLSLLLAPSENYVFAPLLPPRVPA